MQTTKLQELLHASTDSGRVILGKVLIEHLLTMDNGLSRLIQVIVRNSSEEQLELITQQLQHAKEGINSKND